MELRKGGPWLAVVGVTIAVHARKYIAVSGYGPAKVSAEGSTYGQVKHFLRESSMLVQSHT